MPFDVVHLQKKVVPHAPAVEGVRPSSLVRVVP